MSVEPDSRDSESKRQRLVAYLRERAANTDGDLYVKSRHIAEDIDLSAREIGARMAQLQTDPIDLTIERWAYTGGTTWRVTL
ncbi:MAG: hypothetical protein ACI8XM_001089 [Haloarculaceae archaeon]|jgi:hypothetical protein